MGQCTPLQQLRVTMRRSAAVLLCGFNEEVNFYRLVLSIKAAGSSGEPRGRHREVGLP